YHTAELNVWLPAAMSLPLTYTFAVPDTIAGGPGQVWIDAYAPDGSRVGGGNALLNVPSSPVVFTVGRLAPDGLDSLPVPLILTNTASNRPITEGRLALMLIDPDAHVTSGMTTTFALAPLDSQALTLSLDLPPLAFGAHTLVIESGDEYGERRYETRLPATLLAQSRLDRDSYRARETAAVDLVLDNAGPFRLPLTVTLAAPALSYTHTQAFTLDPRAADTLAWDIPVPPDVAAGSYPLYVTATLPSGDVWETLAGPLVVPPARLEWTGDVPPAATAGETLALTLNNPGGVDAHTAVSLRLIDARGLVVAAWTEPVVLQAGAAQAFALDLPVQARSGTYTLLAQAALPGAEPVHYRRLVQIDGVTAGLTAATDMERYTLWDTLTAAATIANGPRPLSDAQLQLEIVQAAEKVTPAAWESCLFDDPGCGLSGSSVQAMAIDAGGNRWFGTIATPEGVVAYLDRLSADGSVWQTFDPPVSDQWLNDVAVDPDGRVWLAFSPSINSTSIGAAVLLSNDTWHTYSAADSGLLSDHVVRIAPDAAGNVWFATHPAWDDDLGDYHDGGLSVLRAGDTWITYTTANSGLLTGSPAGLAVDAAGNVWIAGDGLSQLRANGVWITYTTANSPLLTDSPTDVAVDASGDVWVAGDGLSRLHAGSWLTYTTANSGLQSDQINRLAVAADGRVWAIGNAGVQVYDPATGAGEMLALPGAISPWDIQDLAVGPDPDEVWIAADWQGAARYRPPVATRVLWQETFPVNLAASAPGDVSAYLNDLSALGATGKLYLQARLLAATGQELAAAAQPFYVDPPNGGGCWMTVALTPTVAYPAQPLHVSGDVVCENSEGEYADVYLAVHLDGATIVVSDALTLPYRVPVPYTLTLSAPDHAGVFLVTTELRLYAESTPVTMSERLEVGIPHLQAALEAPSVAGSAPFSVALTLENPSPLPLTLTLARDGAPPETLTLPAGERALRLWSQHITTDTLLTVALSGDVSQVLTRSVAFGESLAATWTPETYSLPGRVAVPYTFTNTGQLDLAFTTDVTLTGALEEAIAATAFTHIVLAGSVSAGQVVFTDIPPGDYTFAAGTPWTSAALPLSVRPAEAATLDVVAAPSVGAAVTMTAHVTNTGAAPLEAIVHVQAPFDTRTPLSLAAAEALTLPLALDLSALAPGVWPLTVTVETGNGAILAAAYTTVAVSPADLVVTAVPTQTRVTAGETVTLTFGVANRGAAPDTAVLTVTLGNLLDGTQRLWLPGGAEGTLAFVFDAPVGLSGEARESSRLVGYYHFGGQRYDLVLPIDGVELSVDAGWDQLFYAPGVTATLRLTVTNHGAAATPPLYAAAVYAGAAFTQPLTLAGGAAQRLDFPLTAEDYTGDTLVFYGVYEEEEQRGIHLNTTYLRLRQPVVTVLPDRTVYRPGDTVHVTVVTTATGAITVTAPGLPPTSYSLFPAPSIQFTLPDNLLRGTYTLDYALTLLPIGGEPEGGSVPFNVDAPWVRVTEAYLLDPRPAPGETLHAELTVASTDALTVAVRSWLRYPDGTRSETAISTIPLAAVLNNRLSISHVLSTAHSGAHQLVYELSVPENQEEVYASGSESFMVGAAALLYFTTDRTVYGDPSAPVTARVGVHAGLTIPATLTLTLDDLSQHTYAFTLLTGTQMLAFTWPQPITLGDHILAAHLSVAGLDATAQTYFRYGVEAADLTVAAPRLSADDGSLTRTVTALVYNQGGFPAITTTVQFWDGAPGVGTLLGTEPLPLLAAGAMTNVTTDWYIQGQGGTHTLYVVVDPTAQVTEFDEDNNTASAVVSLPRLALHVMPEHSTYTIGQPVTAIVTATNLSSATALENLAITTTFEYVGWLTAFQTAHTVTIAAADAVTFPVVWPSTGFTGTYFIRVQATDPTGEFHQTTADFYLAATPPSEYPIVTLGPDRSVTEGSPITLTAVITDAGTPTGHAMTWDFGDGSPPLMGWSPEHLTVAHTYADDGAYTVTLTVTDTTGLSASGSLVVAVENVAPIVTAGPDRAVAAGQPVAFAGAFFDPGVLDTHTIAWDFGDGNTAAGVLTPTHTYVAVGVYTVTLTVADNAGGVGSDALRVTVTPSGAAPFCENLSQPVNYVPAEAPAPCAHVIPAPYKLKLVDSNCAPIPWVLVALRKADGAPIAYASTNVNGVADFSYYAGGVASKFELFYNGDHFTTAVGSYTTGAVVQTQAYRLQFVASDCAPVVDAWVNLRKANGVYVTSTRTDSDGRASFEILPEAQMRLEVYYNGALWRSTANTAATGIVLGAEAFRLLLIDSGGAAIPNGWVALRRANGVYVAYTWTDAGGIAMFDVLPEAELQLTVVYNGATYTTPPSTAHRQETVQTLALGVQLTARGSALAGRRVNLLRANGSYVTHTYTNAEGRAVFEVLPEADYRVWAMYAGVVWISDVVAGPAELVHNFY
ncbi:MAG TPA: PKD domain-containing protein, partial [Chloroflexi bacterium]|nr:PKD domain-containing protein [Chloroflexota bacterium]